MPPIWIPEGPVSGNGTARHMAPPTVAHGRPSRAETVVGVEPSRGLTPTSSREEPERRTRRGRRVKRPDRYDQ